MRIWIRAYATSKVCVRHLLKLAYMRETKGGQVARSSAIASLRINRRVTGVARRLSAGSPVGAMSAAFIIAVVFLGVFADQIAPFGPLETDYDHIREPPTPDHLFGTDSLGRDVLSRIIHGTRVSLWVAIIAVAMSKAVGLAWGVLTGYLGGKFDLISQRFLDVLISFPGVILALLLLVALGTGMTTVIIAIAVTGIAGTTRVIRSVTLSVREMSYVEAARAVGASPLRIMVRHVAPQTIAPVLVLVSASLGGAIFAEAALSFLGMGVPPPAPSWGNILGGTLAQSFKPPWWMALFPGLAIMLTVLSMNLTGDWLRDRLDPRLRQT